MSIIQIQQIFSLVAVIAYCVQWRQADGRRYAAAAGLHALALVLQFYITPYLQLGSVLSVFMLLTFVISWQALRFTSIRRLLLAFTAASVFAPLLLPPAAPVAFSLHAVLALAVYALAAAAFLLCLDLRLVEMQLRRQPQADGGAALLARENKYFNYILLSFILLTLTLLSGMAAAIGSNEAIFEWTHKKLFAYLTWLVFLVLLLGRHIAGWRGQIAQRWFFAGYLFLLLSYIGSAFVAQVILGQL